MLRVAKNHAKYRLEMKNSVVGGEGDKSAKTKIFANPNYLCAIVTNLAHLKNKVFLHKWVPTNPEFPNLNLSRKWVGLLNFDALLVIDQNDNILKCLD